MSAATLTSVPFSKLIAPDTINARGKTKEGLTELAEAIAAKGLIQPLAVRPGDKADTYEVIDGRRRYQALAKLVKDKRWKKADPVPVIVRNEDDAAALETSLMANTVRLPMHAVDQFEVFARLVEQGANEAEIGARFGIGARQVKQKIALGRLAPVVREAWRKGKIDAETAQAFAEHPDHAVQASVFADLKQRGSYGITTYSVRQALTTNRAAVDDYRIIYVGLDAYRAAGGGITESLFSEDRFIDDTALLDALVRAKLASDIERIKADGWAWVELAERLPGSWPHSWRGWPHLKDDTSDQDGSYLPNQFTAEKRARSGVVLDLDNYDDNPLCVHMGVLRPAEGGQTYLEQAIDDTSTACDEDEDDDTSVDDDHAPGPDRSEPVAAGPFSISDALRQTISEADTIAVAKALAGDAELSMRLITAALESRFMAPASIRNDGHACVRANRTRKFEDVFDEMLGLPEAEARERFCAAVGTTLNLTHETWRFKGRDSGCDALREACLPVSYLVAARAAFLANDYFKRASKDVSIAAIDEMREAGAAGGVAPEDVLAGMKKVELAAVATAAATACGWLPPELRTAAYEISGSASVEAA